MGIVEVGELRRREEQKQAAGLSLGRAGKIAQGMIWNYALLLLPSSVASSSPISEEELESIFSNSLLVLVFTLLALGPLLLLFP